MQPPDVLAQSDAQADDSVGQAERELARGEPLQAYNAAQSGLQLWPGHVRLRQVQALALARSGDAERANLLLSALADEGHGDAETLAMLARTHKDLAQAAKLGALRTQHLDAGFGLYARAFDEARQAGSDADAYYAGINAAALAVLQGRLELARRMARSVQAICRRDASAGEDASARYWRQATLGEAALILGDAAEAGRSYARAAALAAGRPGDISSTRRQARLLAAHLPPMQADATQALQVAPVLMFAGNMIDRAERPVPRFPAALEPAVRAALRARLAALKPLAAYGSAACGADLLCLELVREMGGETHIVLPFPPLQFRAASVDFAGESWGQRFEQALASADSVTIASDHHASGSSATFVYANLILTGMARLRAQMLDAKTQALAVWDPQAPGHPGGTGALALQWTSLGLPVEHVHMSEFRNASSRNAGLALPALDDEPGAVRHEMRALLFADAVGYSQLSEDQIPGFIGGFLEAVAGLNRRTAHRCEHVETSGDGLYMVFAQARDAGLYALELSALVRDFDRAACGLPDNFDLRIALHCGPVHCARDPITGGALYTGPHTSRAARIEPVTPPGQVYASSAFAAVVAAGGTQGLALRYVGRIPLAKGHGTLGLYNVRAEALD